MSSTYGFLSTCVLIQLVTCVLRAFRWDKYSLFGVFFSSLALTTGDGPEPNLNPDPEFSAAEEEEANLNPLVVMAPKGVDDGLVVVEAPGLGVVQAAQAFLSASLLTSHTEHFHDPDLGLNISDKEGFLSADEEAGLGVSQAKHLALSASFLTSHTEQVHDPALGLNMSANDGCSFLVVGLAV